MATIAAILAAVAWLLVGVANLCLDAASPENDFTPLGYGAAAAILGCLLDLVGFILAVAAIVQATRIGRGLPLSIAAVVAHILGGIGNAFMAFTLILLLGVGAAAERGLF